MASIGKPIKRIEVEPLHLPPIETPVKEPNELPDRPIETPVPVPAGL